MARRGKSTRQNVLDQKWFSAFAQVEGAEEMVTTEEICAVSLG
jgi:hypothetical protein